MNLMVKPAIHQDQYVLEAQLGQGVFSLTYRATDRHSGQVVVLKTLNPILRQHPEFDPFKSHFLNVAQRLSCCHHPHLVQVRDWFEEDGCPYWVMEYIPGQTLGELLQTGSLPETQAIKYIRQIANALSVLHQAGLCHQDIRPDNIILRSDTDSVVLTELGITCEFTPGILQTHANLLAVGYAPLEQYAWNGKRTPATDIYALTATFYHLLTGQPPLPAPVRETLQADGSDCLFSPDEERNIPHLNSAIKPLLWQGLELLPRQRPQTCEVWLSQLPSVEKSIAPDLTLDHPETEHHHLSIAEQPLQPDLTEERQAGIETPKPTSARKPVGSGSAIPSLTLKEYDNLCLGTPPLSTFTQFQNSKPKSQPSNRKTAKNKARSLLQALLMTGAIAASAGVGFGFALRTNRPTEPGSTILHTQQTFPPRSDWPVVESQL